MNNDPLRSDDVTLSLAKAMAAAPIAGISRLADVTRLDCIGMPVWQAIRPISRSLSVHQGRGRTSQDARLGALMEAMESHAAENFTAATRTSSWDALKTDERYGEWSDFARDEANVPDPAQPVEWTVAACVEGRHHLIPFVSVSMDLTMMLGTGLERSTNGLAAGFSRESARMAALLELIERDAVTTWRQGGLLERMLNTIDLDDVGAPWLDQWRDSLSTAGVRLQCYWVPSISGTPVFAAELSDIGKGTKAYRAVEGTGAHPVPEFALQRAVSEAIQGRCAYIAGSRDDIMPEDYHGHADAVQMVFGLPLPPGMEPIAFASVREGTSLLDEICLAIERAGYGPVAFVDVGQVGEVFVVKAFAAGLAHRRRSRRILQ